MTASSTAVAPETETQWADVCSKKDLAPNTGVCALVNGQQVALFYSKTLDEYFAIGNYDPIGKANVLSRGIIGSMGEDIVVASPLYKQHFNLRTGECMDSPEHSVPVYPLQIVDDRIQVSA